MCLSEESVMVLLYGKSISYITLIKSPLKSLLNGSNFTVIDLLPRLNVLKCFSEMSIYRCVIFELLIDVRSNVVRKLCVNCKLVVNIILASCKCLQDPSFTGSHYDFPRDHAMLLYA